MDYELAEELKGNGFNFLVERSVPWDVIQYTPSKALPAKGFVILNNVLYRIPILEELIEACGDEFHSMERFRTEGDSIEETKVVWCAYPQGFREHQEGKTPVEAVAKLWLKLNAK